MTKNKKIIIICSASALVLILIIAGIFLARNNKSPLSSTEAGKNNTHSLPAVDYLNETEKNKLGVSPETRIQALGRDENGEVTVYKVIKNDGDIVSDPSKIKTISPRDASQKK